MLSESEPPVVRCQASLALAFALSNSGRPDEALLEGLDALARAREAGDRRAQAACLAFLAKLFARVGQPQGAARLQSALGAFARTPSLMDLAEVRRPVKFARFSPSNTFFCCVTRRFRVASFWTVVKNIA